VETYEGAVIEGSVMATNSVEMEGGSIRGELGTPGKVLTENADVKGTVTGKRVTLKETIVRGNVVGTEVILENCIVLGIVASERSLDIQDSLCYTFRSQGETTLEGAKLILPQALVSGTVEMESPVKVAGLGLLDVEAQYDPASAEDEGEEPQGRLPEITEADLYEREDQTYLTLAPRVLNLDKVADRLAELEGAIMDVVNDATDDEDVATDVASVLSIMGVQDRVATEAITET
jgi:hypothetical protein